MDDSNVNDISAQIERARLFDLKLVEIRRKVCEPSLLGAGTKARVAIATVKSEAESLLESTTTLSEDVKRLNAAKVANLNHIQDWIEKMLAQIEPLEAKGIEAGLIQTNGIKENVNNETENGIEKTISNCDSFENSHHPGRKSSISRRLFESFSLTPCTKN
uniref:Putative arginyl-tRNA--protein transferase n=1 Tax=Lygus hesperus TaxID=30085 RepID=A0A0A9WRG6_LYGHE